jgi:hypothetical protein
MGGIMMQIPMGVDSSTKRLWHTGGSETVVRKRSFELST